MTSLLEKAIDLMKVLPEDEQNLIASFILEKLENDWNAQIEKDFSEGGRLEWLREEALAEMSAGKTIDGGFDCR